MIALKKLYGDELLRLALVLSLLKADPNDYLERETQQLLTSISNGSDWSLDQEARTLIRPRYVHPKSLDNILINYERELFEELNSLGRYTHIEDNERMWHNTGPVIHTYLLNDVATDTLVPQTSSESEQDGVSADENVAQEVKVTEEDSETNQSDAPLTLTADVSTNNSNSEGFDAESSQPDAVVTLTADFLSNHSESDVFAEIASRSFDVNEFFQQNEMQIKKETQDDDFREVSIKKEQNTEDLYSDNANDDFVPYFTSKSERFEDPTSVFYQNIADLQDYGELFDVKELKNELEFLDGKRQEEDLEQFLLDNTPLELDPEVYELAPMFDDDLVLDVKKESASTASTSLASTFDEELVLDVKRERASTSFTSASSSGVTDMDLASMKDIKSEVEEEQQSGDDLTQEDMDLIEVLWKQDVDMGFCLEDPVQLEGPQATKVAGSEAEKHEKLSETLQEKQAEADDIEKVKAALLDPEIKEDDPWAGLSYTVDTETGEYVLQGDLPRELVTEESRFDLLEEALQLVELGDEAENKDEQSKAVEGSSSGGDMLHPAMRHVPHHPLAHYHNQRWQDLASLLTIPPPPEQYHHHHHHQQHHQPHPHPHPHNISAHGAVGGYAPNYHTPLPPVPEKHPDHYAGAAAPLEGAYKVESAHHPQQHDGLYYQNSTAEMAPPATQDGFLQSILNDEDLQLMDMAMNEGMYTMRMLDGAGAHHNHTHMMMTTTERDSASDSAVSSMGSERVPSLSDGEWCDGSDSAQEFHSSKFRPYEAAYGRDRTAPHQPQKKHHMFGKRCFQEQPPPQLEPLPPRPPVVKYECPEQAYHHDPMQMHADFGGRPLVGGHPLQPTLDLNGPHTSHALLQGGVPGRAGGGARHNHTYAAPPAPPHARPVPTRDKRVRRMTDGSMSDGGSSSGHVTRDEKRAKALGESKQRNVRYALAQHGIPLEVHDIINLPMDEFNERLSKHDLSEAQLSLIRDIRRRGKNKVAAQNCRKRKLDQITSLADEVRTVRDRKQRTQRDHHALQAERQRVKERFAALYRHVFQSLRDSEGRALSSAQYSLQQAADGSVVLVPKMPHNDHSMNRTDDDMDRKTKNYEQ